MKDIILKMLENAEEKVLTVGENEFFLDNGEYNLQIEYSLENDNEFAFDEEEGPLFDNYVLNLESIHLIDNHTYEEFDIEPTDEIHDALMADADIEDWTNDETEEFLKNLPEEN